jgi:hypothetical protein
MLVMVVSHGFSVLKLLVAILSATFLRFGYSI